MKNNYLIYGAGGHAKVLKDLISTLADGSVVLTYFNDSSHEDFLHETPVCSYSINVHPDIPIVLGIGSGKVRKILTQKVKHKFASLVHPKAIVAHGVEIGEGTVILAGAVVQSGAKIGKHVIVNSNVTVDHDAVVGDFVTTYPGVYIGAETIIAESTTINPNAVIMRFSKTEAFSEIKPCTVVNSGQP